MCDGDPMIMTNDQASDPAASDLRVGYLLRMYPRFSQTFVVNEILELERQGADVEILSLRKPNEGYFHDSVSRVRARADYAPEVFLPHARGLLAAQWRMFRKAPRRYLVAMKAVMRHRGARWFDLMQAAYVVKWAGKKKINHLHVHFGTEEATVAMLSRMMGGPSYSLTLHAFDIFRDNVDKALLAAKINTSRFVVTVSEFNRRYICSQIPGVFAEKVRVNYNGIDLNRFSNGHAAREPNTVLSVGRLIEKKGFIHLVRAIARLRDGGLSVRCRIVGDGRERKRLQKTIEKEKLTELVELPGEMRQEEVSDLMKSAACFVLPCVQAKDGNIDALPTVLLESLAAGCPSVSTRISGVPEIIESETSGLLVEPGDDVALAKAIRRILEDRDLASAVSEGGRRRAMERFDGVKNVAVMRDWLWEPAQRAGRAKPPEVLDDVCSVKECRAPVSGT